MQARDARRVPAAGLAPLAGWAVAAGWLAGCALQLRQAETLAALAAGTLLATGLLLLAGAAAARRRLAAPAVAALAAVGVALAAFGSTDLRASARLAERLAPALEGLDLVVTGTVADLPRLSLAGTAFVFEVEQARDAAGRPVTLPSRLALSWTRGFDVDARLTGPAEDLRAGQRWQLPLRLRQPHGAANPGGFDAELWWFEQGIGATGTVRAGPGRPAWKLAETAGHPVDRLRQDLRDRILVTVGDGRAGGVLAALAVGDQAAIARDDWDLFRATGVAHLMSISGLHVTMFAWLAAVAIGALWRRAGRLPLLLPAASAARWGGVVAATAYALLAGWGVPAQRTVAMLAVVALLRSHGGRWPLPAVLVAAALAVTVADPWALLQPGFWLSFVAVALLSAAEPVRGARAPSAQGPTPATTPGWRGRLHAAARHARAAARDGWRAQWVASVGLAPLSMLFFQQVSAVGFVANLVAIPLVTLLVTPLALLGLLLPPLWWAGAALVQGLVALLTPLAASPLAVWSAAAAPAWAAAAGLLGGLVLVLPLPWHLRALGLPLLLPLLWPAVERPPPGRFEIVVADVGQGSAVLVRTARHLLVHDTGPAFGPEADAGDRVLLPLLRHRGERAIDRLVLSHGDSDHTGGATSLIAGLPVRELLTSLPAAHPLRTAGPPHRDCRAGDGWTWDGVRFEVLHPTAEDVAFAAKSNAVSCVVRVAEAAAGPGGDPPRTLLLTGDIEAAQEARLLARAAAPGAVPLASTVVVVPHHGSRTSSTPAFVAAAGAQWAPVQAAYRSRFGHPVPEVVARWERHGARVVRSDRCGAWTLPADDRPPACHRETARRYWHHRP